MNDREPSAVPGWMRARARRAADDAPPLVGRPQNAEQRLMSWSWCLRHSAFALGGLGLGLTGWLSFLYLGLQARRRRWLVYSALWALFALVAGTSLVVTLVRGTDRLIDEPVGLYLLWAALIQTLHLVFIRDPWLRWRAVHPTGSADWKTYPELVIRYGLYPLKAPLPRKPYGNGVLDEIDGARQPAVLDLNLASASDLTRELGLDAGWAQAIIATRDRLGGFRSLDQLAEAGLPPRLFNALVDRLGRASGPPAEPSAGQAPSSPAVERTGTPPATPAPSPRGRRLEL